MFIRTNHFISKFVKCYSTNALKLSNEGIAAKRLHLFNNERERQNSLISRLHKIKVSHTGTPEKCSLLMNKDLSTPYNVAMHLSEVLMKRSVVALVNGKPWDMHRPLVEDCDIEFLHFKDDNPVVSNNVFWRSCSFIVGYVMERAFKDKHAVNLCRFPSPNVESGSFVYDVGFDFDWTPSEQELRLLSRIGSRLHNLPDADARIERLEVDASIAIEMFQNNPYKSSQIESIASQSSNGNNVTLYKLNDHVDISNGPMMSSANLIGRFDITSIHDIETKEYGTLQRIQGIAMPNQLSIHYWAYEMLAKRAKKLNPATYPSVSVK